MLYLVVPFLALFSIELAILMTPLALQENGVSRVADNKGSIHLSESHRTHYPLNIFSIAFPFANSSINLSK